MVMALGIKNCEICGRLLTIDSDGPYCMLHGKLFRKGSVFTSNKNKDKPAAPAKAADPAAVAKTPAVENKTPAPDEAEAKIEKPAADLGAADAQKARSSADLAPVPQKPTGIKAIHEYFELNKSRIIADCRDYGVIAAAAHWNTGNSTFYHLLASWGIESPKRGLVTKKPSESKLFQSNNLPPVPVKPAGPPQTIAAYYDANRDLISLYIEKLGQSPALKLWQISSGTWSGIQKRWKRAEVEKQPFPGIKITTTKEGGVPPPGESPTPAATPALALASAVTMPAYPHFRDDWQPEVQIRWLEIFEDLQFKPK